MVGDDGVELAVDLILLRWCCGAVEGELAGAQGRVCCAGVGLGVGGVAAGEVGPGHGVAGGAVTGRGGGLFDELGAVPSEAGGLDPVWWTQGQAACAV